MGKLFGGTLMLIVLLVVSGSVASGAALDAPAAGLTHGPCWGESVWRHHDQAPCASSPDGADCQLMNAEQGFRAAFGAGRIVVVPEPAGAEDASWMFEWQTVALGRENLLRPLEMGVLRRDDLEVSYEYAGELSEHYSNGPSGLRQHFHLSAPPEGHGALVLVGLVGGSLCPACAADGQLVEFVDARGERVLQIRDLHVLDAACRELSSRFELLETGSVQIAIDDRGARYPLTIGPLLTSPVDGDAPGGAIASAPCSKHSDGGL